MVSSLIIYGFVIVLALTFLVIARYDDMQEEKRQRMAADK